MNTKNAILLVALASLWGPSFLFIKVAVEEIPPLSMTAMRVGLAAILMNLYLLSRGERLPTSFVFWKKVLIAGFFMHSLPFALINWGEQYVDSGIASILNGLTPLSTILLANFMIADESLTTRKVIGLVLGFAGLIVLALPNLINGFEATTAGILAVSIAAMSYGVGMVFGKKYLSGIKANHAPAGQLLAATIYLVPIALLFDTAVPVATASWQALGAVAILGTFGTALAFVIYFKIIERASTSYLSMVTYIMPIYGVILGIVFLGEQLSMEMIIGLVFILSGIGVVNYKPNSKRMVSNKVSAC